MSKLIIYFGIFVQLNFIFMMYVYTFTMHPSETVLTLHLTPIFSYLVKAEERNLSTDIDARRTYAEHAVFLEAPLGVDCACCQSSRKSWRHHNGYNVQRTDHELCPCCLRRKSCWMSIMIYCNINTQIHYTKKKLLSFFLTTLFILTYIAPPKHHYTVNCANQCCNRRTFIM